MTKMHSLKFYFILLNLNLNSHKVLVSTALGISRSFKAMLFFVFYFPNLFPSILPCPFSICLFCYFKMTYYSDYFYFIKEQIRCSLEM